MAIWATWALPSQERSRKHDRFSESSLEFRNFALHCLALEILLMASGGTFRGRCAGASEHIIKIRKDNGFVRKREEILHFGRQFEAKTWKGPFTQIRGLYLKFCVIDISSSIAVIV